LGTSTLALTFRIFKGDHLIREERLAQGVIKVGKVPSAHLRIDDETVSRMHAIVEVTGRDVNIIDLGSTRGTFVNGQKINKAKLHTGDSILLGDSRVEVAIADAVHAEAVAAPARPAPVAAPVPPPMPRASGTGPVVTLQPPRPGSSPPIAIPPAAPVVLQVAPASSVDEVGGAKAVEVAAMLGDTVIGVKHCMDPRGGKVTRATWALAAGGLACLLASAIAFYASVGAAAENAAAFARHTRVLHRSAYSFRPHEVGGLVDAVAFGGLALGLAAMTLALVRARGERRSPFYRIGTAPGVEQPIEHAPSESFPLVAPSGDDFVFNYGPGIDGELIADGRSTPLAELVASGRVRPSATTPGAIEIPIPAMAKIRARAGQTTFLVSAVARPKRQATTTLGAALESRTVKYVVGSLATHLAIVFLLYQVDIAEAGVNVELTSREALPTLAKIFSTETMPQKQEEADPGTGESSNAEQAAGMKLPEGVAGDPQKQKPDGKLLVKDNKLDRQLSVEEAREAARTAGVLGSTLLRDSISSITSTLPISSGFDTDNQWGLVDGNSGAGRGTFGMGVNGDHRGGGCLAEPCGLVLAGAYGTIPGGRPGGGGYKLGSGGNGTLRTHVALAPTFSPPVISGEGIDKSIIKRYIKQRQSQISYCYEKELLAHPTIAGEVKIQFLISPTGVVQSSTGAGFDGAVAGCVANVIQTIAFPAIKSGTPVTVNYPFIFRTAGRG
jgi:hypothetical protein